MESLTLYIVGIALPVLSLLIAVTILIHTVGEFKETNSIIPKILLMITLKILILSTLCYTILDPIFTPNALSDYTIICYGLLIFFELFITCKQLLTVNRIRVCNSRLKFQDKYTRYILCRVYSIHFSVVLITYFLITTVYCLTFYQILNDLQYATNLSLIILSMFIYIKVIIFKHLKS